MYEHRLSAAFFAERAPESAHQRYPIPPGLGAFAQAPEYDLQSTDGPNVLPQQFLGVYFGVPASDV